jgi:antagonist of KipI
VESSKSKKNDELSFGKCIYGCRSYIAFAGGIDVPKVMGSRSTFVRGNSGGVEGRALKTGDRLPIGKSQLDTSELYGRKLRFDNIPDFKTNRSIRFIVGPHDYAFTKESIYNFVTTTYTLSNEADRMGYRLSGKTLQHVHGADIISDFITVGTIQVPGNGQPIIHMADCGTSGGYTKLGVIIGVDIPYIAQKKPGDQIVFEKTEISFAQERWKKQEQLISSLRISNALVAKKSLILQTHRAL